MNHPSTERLGQFLDDLLQEGDNQEISTHLDFCPECCQTIERLLEAQATILNSHSSDETDCDVQSEPTLSDTGPNQSKAGSPLNFGLRFIPIEEIARGGMGIVYRSYDRELKREVAIKVTRDNDAHLTARFFREAQISGQLQHPGAVPVYEMGQLPDGRSFMAMRLVNGQTLSTLMTGNSEESSLAANLEVFRQICQTMAYAHSQDFVHRDLKPDNVMVGAFGEVQIMDWGLAKKTNESDDFAPEAQCAPTTTSQRIPTETIPGQLMGTPAYMAPEQANGEVATKRTDVFALGGILFQMLTGKAPFDESTQTQALSKSASASLTDQFSELDHSDADQSLIDIVKRCLNPAPSNRPADAEVVNQHFSQYIEKRERDREESRLAEVRYKERLLAQQKRNRQLIWSASAIVVALAISAIAGLMYLNEKNTRIANQSKVEQERIEKTLRDEQKLRSILDTAAEHEKLAGERNPVEQAEQWILARKEIEKARTVVSNRMDPELRAAYEKMEQRICLAAENSIQVNKDYEAELTCSQQIQLCSEQSFYPDDLRKALARDLSIATQLGSAFDRIAVSPDDDFERAAERIAGSELKSQLILGLLVWQRELRLDASATASEVLDWLDRLIVCSDDNSLHTRLRSLEEPGDSAIKNLIDSEDAMESPLTVHTVVHQIPNLSNSSHGLVEYIHRAASRYPEDFLVNWYLASATSEDDENRLEYALKCNTLRPENLAAQWILGKTSVAQGKFPQAVEALDKLVATVPDFADARIQLAIALGQTGQVDRALAQYKTALQLEPNRPAVFHNRGALHVAQRNYKAAKADLDRFRKLQPDSSAVDELIVQNYQQSKHLPELIQELNRIIKKAPEVHQNYDRLWEAHKKLGDLQDLLGRKYTALKLYDDAKNNYLELTRLFPDLSTPREILARHLEHRGQLSEAVAPLKEAIERSPDSDARTGDLMNRLARLGTLQFQQANNRKLVQQAIIDLTDVTEFIEARDKNFTTLPDLYTALGRLHQRDGQLEKAIEVTSHAYALQHNTPDDAHIKMQVRGPDAVAKLMEAVGLPSLWTVKEGPGKTKAALDRMNNPKAVSSLGMLLIKQGSPEKAEEMIRKAITQTPDSSMLQFVLAKSLAAQVAETGDKEKQDECFEILNKLQFLDNQFHTIK